MSKEKAVLLAGAIVAVALGCGGRERSAISDAGADVSLGVPLQPVCGLPNAKNPNKQIAPTQPGTTSSVVWTIRPDDRVRRPFFCRGSTVSASELPVAVVEVSNPGARPIEVSIYQSRAPNMRALDTFLWVYPSTERPTTPENIGACISIADACSVEPETACGNGDDAFGFAGVERITIGAGCAVLVYNAGSSDTEAGPLTVNVRLDRID